MSAELLIQFESRKEMERFWADHSAGKKACVIKSPDVPNPPKDYVDSILYVEFNKTLWGRNVLSLEYAIWDGFGSEWAKALGQQICKRYKVKRVGWDSIGWETDRTLDEFVRSSLFFVEVTGYKRMFMEASKAKDKALYKKTYEHCQKMSRWLKREAKKAMDSGKKWEAAES